MGDDLDARSAAATTAASRIARARTSTVRDLEKDAARCKPGDVPPTGEPEEDPPREWVDLTFRFSPAEADAVIQSLARARLQGGFTREEVTDGTLIATMSTSSVEEKECASPTPTGERFKGGSDTDRLEAMCDSEVIDMRPGPNQGTATRTRKYQLRHHSAAWRAADALRASRAGSARRATGVGRLGLRSLRQRRPRGPG